MAIELSGASGEGFATIAADGRVLDSWFLQLRLVEADKTATSRDRWVSRRTDMRDTTTFAMSMSFQSVQTLPPLHLRRLMCTTRIFGSIS